MTLRAANLAFAHRPGSWVFQDLSASFAPGQTTAILGPNGAGKSTLLRCLLGLLRPERGSVTLGGQTVHDLPEHRRAMSLAYVPQRPSAALGFSVADVVALGCGPRSPGTAARASAKHALEALDLASRADEPFCELSHGQQQRAVLARAMAQLDTARTARSTDTSSPLALLADEPTSAMDPRHAAEAIGLMRAQAALGCVVVVVLHDLTAALRAADRVLLLDADGRVAADGHPDEALIPETLGSVYGIEFSRLTDPASGLCALVPASAPPGR